MQLVRNEDDRKRNWKPVLTCPSEASNTLEYCNFQQGVVERVGKTLGFDHLEPC